MTIDEIQEEVEDISDDLNAYANQLDNLDLSDLSSDRQHFIRQAAKLMRTAAMASEEAAQYLEEI